ncbi:MAG TPA: 3-oxoacyl-[acyl-carrier-protein] synthase III C-terminal domain-containing protein, partial [Bacillota bacterium]
CGLSLADVDYYIPHQANLRIIESSARRFGLPMDRVFVNIDRYGNTSSASIPVALDEALEQGRIAPGDLVLLVAFGGGLTWGAAVCRWTLDRTGAGARGARNGRPATAARPEPRPGAAGH